MTTISATTPSTEIGSLVIRIQNGERGAESELVERYRRGLIFMLRELCRDHARAEDLAQEALAKAIEKLRAGELRETEKLPGYIRGIARHLLLAERRRRVNRPAPGVDQIAPPADPSPDAETLIGRQQDASLVRHLLAGLEPERDREILLRFYLREESKEALCEEFALSRAHFSRVLHRARARFRQLLENAGLTSTQI